MSNQQTPPGQDQTPDNRPLVSQAAADLIGLVVLAIPEKYQIGQPFDVPAEGFEPDAVTEAIAVFGDSEWHVEAGENVLTVRARRDIDDDGLKTGVTGPTGPKPPKPDATPPEPKPIIHYPPEPGPNRPVPAPTIPPVIPQPIVPPAPDPNSPPAPPA